MTLECRSYEDQQWRRGWADLFSPIISKARWGPLIYGTLVLSSATFIDTHDGIFIIFRYIFSTVVCRMISVFEVYGLRAAAVSPGIDQAHVMEWVELGS